MHAYDFSLCLPHELLMSFLTLYSHHKSSCGCKIALYVFLVVQDPNNTFLQMQPVNIKVQYSTLAVIWLKPRRNESELKTQNDFQTIIRQS